jgi:hypothetical protein
MTDAELLEHLDKVSADFKGNSAHLYTALGAAIACRSYGWKVVRITTSSPVYTRNQRILGMKFKDEFPEETSLSRKSIGLAIVQGLGKFWEVVRGTETIPSLQKTALE